jgi:hypothetical protein
LSHRNARLLTLLMAASGICLTATGAEAQSGRYMTWANRPVSTSPATLGAALTKPAEVVVDAPAGPPRSRNDLIPRRVAPSQGPARPTMRTADATLAPSRGLTPASAWLGPRVAPAFASGTPAPVPYAASEMIPAPLAASIPAPSTYAQPAPIPEPVERAAPDPMAPRRDAAIFSLQRQAPPAQHEPAQLDEHAADPMAPRRDARIFQLQPQSAPPQQTAEAAPPQGAQTEQSRSRYYSVHRDAGRQPDPAVLPEPVYFDSVTVDLAEPPASEPLVRDAQGRRRVVANVDPSQQ